MLSDSSSGWSDEPRTGREAATPDVAGSLSDRVDPLEVEGAKTELRRPNPGCTAALAAVAVDAAPCDLLSDELVRAHFDVGHEEILRQESRPAPHPTRTATWLRADAAVVEAARDKAMTGYLLRKMAGEDAELPQLSGATADPVLHITVHVDGGPEAWLDRSREVAIALLESL